MSTHSWETLSNQATAAAAVVYFLALLATLVEWSALVGRSKSVAVAAEPVREPAAVGAAMKAGSSGGLEAGAGARSSATVSTANDDRVAFFSRLGFLLMVIGALCHAIAVVARGLAADRVPWGNMFEFTLTGTCIVAIGYVVLYRKLRLAWMAPLVIAFVLVFLMVGVLVLYAPVEPLTEALHSYWLVIHVIAAALATGAFTLGGMASVMYLIKERSTKDTGWIGRVPSLETLDRTSYRLHAFGFPVWTFAVLITGPIWAHQAWGSYWNWDPKEVWAFITWVVYAGYLHARATGGWKGRRAAILALVGVGTLWFNFIGINYFSTDSQHSYASEPAMQIVQTVQAPR